jgi:TPR repeat protein
MRKLVCLALGVALFIVLGSRAFADGAARRAFVVGVERYADSEVQSLTRSNTDAKDIAHDLQQVGFDPKDIAVVADPRSKADFNKKFDSFLNTIKEGDFVVFFFSGHGLGVESSGSNYLLMGDVKSPVTYTRSKLSGEEKKDYNIVKAKMAQFLDQYSAEEIPNGGVSVGEIVDKIAAKKPATIFVVLDACRNMLRGDLNNAQKTKRSATSGSRLVPFPASRDGLLVLYSASFGEQAVESFGSRDRRRNSLFTEVLRSELPRPGQSLTQLAERVRLVVSALASKGGRQQEPDYFSAKSGLDEVYLVDTIGERRFRIASEKCAGAKEAWERLGAKPRRVDIEAHIRRYDGCETAEAARRAQVAAADSAEDSQPQVATLSRRPVDPCDQLAASDTDKARPPEVSGVDFSALTDPDGAVEACKSAVEKNPRVVRFLFNLGRAYMARANALDPARQKHDQEENYRLARLAYDDAQQRGYLAALYNLGVIYNHGLGVEQSDDKANELYRKAAEQGFPLAMFIWAQRLAGGDNGVVRDDVQAYEWFAKASDAGYAPATYQVGRRLLYGNGVDKNPRRAVEILQHAADAGSVPAKIELGNAYFDGGYSSDPNFNVNSNLALALLWFGRAAEANSSVAQRAVALMLEHGWGASSPQPELAERYWRFAAYGGNEDAEVEFAERLRLGHVLAKPENGDAEAIRLWERAESQGSARAALALARAYREGSFGVERKDPVLAMEYAYQAIDLSVKASPLTEDGNPFYEFAAGHLLAEMAVTGEASSTDGQPLLSKDEVDRLERFYGKVDPATKTVKARRLTTQLTCYRYGSTIWKTNRYYDFWVWDWGRDESPTEPQLRSLEYQSGCGDNQDLRNTLSASYLLSKKNSVAFADLIMEQIKTALAASDVDQARSRRKH